MSENRIVPIKPVVENIFNMFKPGQQDFLIAAYNFDLMFAITTPACDIIAIGRTMTGLMIRTDARPQQIFILALSREDWRVINRDDYDRIAAIEWDEEALEPPPSAA